MQCLHAIGSSFRYLVAMHSCVCGAFALCMAVVRHCDARVSCCWSSGGKCTVASIISRRLLNTCVTRAVGLIGVKCCSTTRLLGEHSLQPNSISLLTVCMVPKEYWTSTHQGSKSGIEAHSSARVHTSAVSHRTPCSNFIIRAIMPPLYARSGRRKTFGV